ncbi:MAG: cell division protein FtsZ [Euryarchaeota archaeon]|nr:cell division protein FtsZ [Euryarchaeota archaeon]
MKSIIESALAKHEVDKKKEEVLKDTEQWVSTSPDDEELKSIVDTLKVSIKIIGCGGGGCNTVDRLTKSGVVGAELMALNTDAAHLLSLHSPRKMLIGRKITKGLGAGALPEVGEQAAKENEDDIKKFLTGSNIVFITAGMGGGTGTGVAPYVARMSKESGALVMAVVTLPFKAEGHLRMENALKGLDRLRKFCDTTIVIANDKLLELVPRLPLDAAFKVADELLMNSIKGITEIITKPGLVNLDYSDLMTVMKNGGVAMIGLGESDEDRERVDNAVNEALQSPLLGDVDISQAKGALVRIVGSGDMTVQEAQHAPEMVGQRISPQARIIWGCSLDPTLDKTVKILLVLTGVKFKGLSDLPMVSDDSGKGFDVVR